MMKKILFVIGKMSNGGAERVVSLLAGELNKKGYEISIITIIDNTIDYQLDPQIHIIPVKYKGKGVRKNFFRIIDLRNEMKKHDIVISFLAIINMATLLAGVGLKKYVILSERNDPAKEPGNKIERVIRNLLYKIFHCNYFVFQTTDARNYFSDSIKRKSIIIPNPISELPAPYLGERKRRIVTIARLEPQKNLKLLLRSFARIVDKYPDYTLDIYGKGPQLEELKEYKERLNLQDKVKFHGFVNNVYEEIKDAGMYVMSSDYEGISNGMLEALGLGIPVVATDCPVGGARMFIQHGVNGLLVPTGNEDELTEAILKIIEQPEYAKELGKSALNIKKRLNKKKIVALWEKLIEDNQ